MSRRDWSGEKGTNMNDPRLRSLVVWCATAALLGIGFPAFAGGPRPQEDDLDKLLEETAAEVTSDEANEAAEADGAMSEEAGEEAAPAEEEVPEEPEVTPAPPRPRPARRVAEEAPEPARRAGDERGRDPDNVFEELGLTRSARKQTAEELVRMAEGYLRDSELIKAEGRLEEARRLDPDNANASRLLSEVRLLLGDQRGTVAQLAHNLAEEQKVQRDQAVTVIRTLLQDGLRHQDAGEYSRAVTSFERALNGIRGFHFNLNLENELREAQAGLAKAKQQQKDKEEEDRQRFEEIRNQDARSERATSTRYLENQLSELRRKARTAEAEKDFDRAILFYERILIVNPQDIDARDRLTRAKEQRHTKLMNDYLRRGAENYELAVLSIEESSVVYQQIFRYPDAREWERLAPKVVSIEDELAATESAAEKEIKRKLDQPFSIGFDGETLNDALSKLHAVTGITFVISKDGADAGEKPIKLDMLEDTPVKNLLPLILLNVGENYTFAIKEGAIVIGPKESLKQKDYLRFYEISDIIQVHPDFKAPPLALDELKGKNTGGAAIDIDVGGDDESRVRPLEIDKLLEILKNALGETEDDKIRFLQGRLSVRSSLENHLKLSSLLSQFRTAAGLMVTVESRFLDIQDNFLEEIGVNFGSGNANFLPNNIPDIDGSGTSVSPGLEWVDDSGDKNVRLASIGNLSQPLGTKVNPFNISSSGGGIYQLNVLKAERYQLEAILSGVAKDQEIRKLNSPRVTAFNGQIAHTLVVNQAAYIQDLEVNQTGVIPVINPVIDVLNSGSILEVRPTVSHDRKYVVLEIQPTLAERLTPERAVLQLSGNFTVVPIELPVLSVTKIKTTITVPDGGTVLVGGLKREIANKSQVGIPGFLDFPIINLIFGRKGNSILRSNLFVLINAKITIVSDEEARLFGT